MEVVLADSGWMGRFERTLGNLAVKSHRNPVVALVIAGVLTAVGAFFSARLPMVADLEKLLPKTFDSVKGLDPLKERFGGIGYVVVVGVNGTTEQLKAFADEYAPRMEKELPGIRYVDHKRSGRFFEERKLYYLSLEDLKEVARRVKEREKYERRQLNPMFVKLDEEEVPSLDMSDIELKYGTRSDQRLASGGDYYLDEERKLVVLLGKPDQIASDLTFSERVVVAAEDYFKKQDLTRFGPNFRISLTGTFKYKVDQQRQLSNDMTRATILAFLLLIGYLIFHFRGILPVFCVLVPVSVGLAWTYGATFFIFGGINILTGFLGAVLGGLGTEHGIHLVGRYSALRSEGESSEEATRDAFSHTGSSAITSSLVAALTFMSIAFSEFGAFREFGVIAAIGMLVVVASYFLVLPAVFGLASKFGWKPRGISMTNSELAHLLPKHQGKIALGVGAVLALMIYEIPGVRFDYDFGALEDSTLPSFELDAEVNNILGYNMEPVVILTNKTSSERMLVEALKQRQKEQGTKSTIDFVAALDDLVPTQQAEKREVLDQIKKTLDKVDASALEADTAERLANFKKMVEPGPFQRGDIPISVRRQFEGIKPGQEGGFVLIFPNIKLSEGLEVVRFAKEVRGIELPNGEKFSAAGEAMILADVLLMVLREGKPILFAAIFSVLLAMWIMLRSLKLALLCMMPTVLSILAQTGMMTILDLPFNYLNILLVPVMIGTTVDAGVHLVSRITENKGNFGGVYGETGRAIVGGLVTSGVGFSAMLLADHPGLNSMGRLAILGFAINLIVMLVFFPAVLLWLQKKGLIRSVEANSGEPAASVSTDAKP